LLALGTVTAPPTPTITLNFDSNGRVGGSDGCNQYQGSYTISGSAFKISGDLMGTMMACPDDIETRAGNYREALSRAATFELENSQLRLSDAAGRLLVSFVPTIGSVAGTDWEVVAYNNGKQGVVSVITGTQITGRFGDDDRVTGNAGCNEYFASYELGDGTLRIGPTGATRMFCAEPEGAMEQEALYLDALQSAATFQLDSDTLQLRTASGALAVTFRRM
jgi:heat shock protein HslJ